ncbi:RNA polymerase sigma factor [Roseivirga sp.]|uniref:RNA polymerase sigma factor n=1 Tax=Roseivirga sp. TaxID=1964215 RepID=UPI003B524D6E
MSLEKDFLALLRTHEGLIHKVTRIYTDTTADKEDLYQEIIYQWWKSFQSFKGDSKISTWLYKVALNTAIVHLKKRKKRKGTDSINDQVLDIPETDDSVKEEQLDSLTKCIKRLNEIDRTIILCYLDGKSHEEISLIVGLGKSNIGTRIGRIKKRIKETLKLDEDGI